MTLRADEWVEVRSKEEILRTLDKNGRLDDMPFMPEMFAYCGKRLPVYKRAHKSCDTINPVSSRTLTNSVLLGNLRCNGAAHGGCQAQCSIFWKEAWLRPVANGAKPSVPGAPHGAAASQCSEEDVQGATQNGVADDGRVKYRCQATDFPIFSSRLRIRHLPRAFIEDYTSGNVGLKAIFQTTCYFLFKRITGARWEDNGGPAANWYDRFQKLWGGLPFPRRHGSLAAGAAEPLSTLNLQPGELVRVKSYEDILATINKGNKNRGLYFDAEMMPYCGGVYRVRSRVDQFLDEKTGVMLKMKTPAVILEGGWCRSFYSEKRAFCPRAIYAWWREAWLERAPESAVASTTNPKTRASLDIRPAEDFDA